MDAPKVGVAMVEGAVIAVCESTTLPLHPPCTYRQPCEIVVIAVRTVGHRDRFTGPSLGDTDVEVHPVGSGGQTTTLAGLSTH